MFYNVAIESLYSFYQTSAPNSLDSFGYKNVCLDNTNYNVNYNDNTLAILDKPINILFTLEKDFLDAGYYTSFNSDYFNELEYPDSYFVTGDTVSRLSEVTTYNNKLIEGLNFNQGGQFTGVLDVTDEYVHYVFNAMFSGGTIIEKTGVEYYTFFETQYSFLKYYPKNVNNIINDNFYYKGDETFFEFSPLTISPNPVIDRGDYLNPMYSHETLSEINSLDDLQFSIFNI